MTDNIIILDVETTGLDPSKGAKLIEVGALLYNLRHRKVIQTVATLFSCDENKAIEINQIDPLLTQCSMGNHFPLIMLNDMAKHAIAIVAHNAEFDKKFMKLCLTLNHDFWDRPWLCTKKDFKWPVQLFRNRLQDVCEAMGIAYVNTHRSLNDCQFIADCFSLIDDLDSRFKSCLYSLKQKQGFNATGNQYVR